MTDKQRNFVANIDDYNLSKRRNKMITINNLEEMQKYYDERLNTYIFNDDVEFNINVDVDSDIVGNGITARNIKANNITALDIDAWNIDACDIKANDIDALNIKAWNIDACDINACDINACDIKAQNIDAYDIDALNIKANNITALDIDANNIDAWNINYYAYCIAYYTFKCKSAKSSRDNSVCKCLDKEIEYIK